MGIHTGVLPTRMSQKFVDLHCHCLPSLDDGPESPGEAIALCRALVRDNIGVVLATPHQLGRFEGRTSASMVREATQQLNQWLGEEDIDLRVFPGAEVRLDERIDGFLAEGVVLTLADKGRHILVELPDEAFIDIRPLLVQLMRRGTAVLIAHAERNAPLLARPSVVQRWLDWGVGLQVTAASLTGRFGSVVRLSAWELITRGWVDVVATDAHDCGASGPCMAPAFAMIAARFGRDCARLLCVENPLRVLRGENLVRMSVWNEQGVG
jgi:protein-tyrosine phosphatase